MLKRAENALFSRAINAIRPIEIKKICPERQKLYSNELTIGEQDKSPTTPTSATAHDKSADSIQITLLNSEQERSVEIKNSRQQQQQQHTKTPPPNHRSIKERLGKKLNDNSKSRSRTPQRKFTDNRLDRTKSRSKERRSREHDKRRAIADSKDRKHRSPKSDSRRSPELPQQQQRRNERQKSTERSAGGGSATYRDRRRNSSETRDKKDYKDSKGGKARDRDEKDSQSTATGRDDRDKELEKARVRARIREQERKAQQGLSVFALNF